MSTSKVCYTGNFLGIFENQNICGLDIIVPNEDMFLYTDDVNKSHKDIKYILEYPKKLHIVHDYGELYYKDGYQLYSENNRIDLFEDLNNIELVHDINSINQSIEDFKFRYNDLLKFYDNHGIKYKIFCGTVIVYV